jgi:DNA-binding MarR family transcriptional regulator
MTPPTTAGPAAVDAHRLTEAVARLRRVLRAGVRTEIAWETLPMAQVEVLQSLAELAPARVGDLAERLHLANSTVSGLVSQMLNAGLVERTVDPGDRRAAVLTLCDAGRARLAEWSEANERRIAAAVAGLPETERRSLQRALPALESLASLLAG